MQPLPHRFDRLRRPNSRHHILTPARSRAAHRTAVPPRRWVTDETVIRPPHLTLVPNTITAVPRSFAKCHTCAYTPAQGHSPRSQSAGVALRAAQSHPMETSNPVPARRSPETSRSSRIDHSPSDPRQVSLTLPAAATPSSKPKTRRGACVISRLRTRAREGLGYPGRILGRVRRGFSTLMRSGITPRRSSRRTFRRRSLRQEKGCASFPAHCRVRAR